MVHASQSFTALRNVILTLFLTFPAIINILALLALAIFMYAVLGVYLFAELEPGEVLSEGIDFRNVAHASQVLWECMTDGGFSR